MGAAGCQFSHHRIDSANAVSQTRSHSGYAPVNASARVAHGLLIHATVLGHGLNKHLVQPLNVCLQRSAHGIRQGLVGVAVDLVFASKDVRYGDAVIGQRTAKVHMSHDHANRAHVRRIGKHHLICRTCSQVGSAGGHAIGHRHNGLAATGGVNALGQLKRASHFTAGAVHH